MDRNQLTNDPETVHRYAQRGLQASLWTAMPAIVTKVDLTAMTIEAQPAIQGIQTLPDDSTRYVNLPLLLDVPLVFPSGGGGILTMPVAIGDEVLVVFGSRCIDAWWQQGGVQPPMELRMHDLSDGFAIPGPRSQPKKVTGGISSSAAQLRNNAGTAYLGLNTSTNKFQLQNATATLKGVLSDTAQIESDIASALTTFGTGLTVGTLTAKGTALAAAMVAVVASLTALNTKIGALLE